MWSGDLNSGLHSCAASTLASEVASQPSSYPSEQSHQTPFFFPVEDENYILLPREFSGKACVKWQARCWRTNTSLAFPAIFYQRPGPKLYRVLTEKPHCREFLVGMTWISVLKRRKKKKSTQEPSVNHGPREMFRRWTVSLSPERSHSWDAESGLRSSKSARVGRPHIKQVCSRISIFV